MDQKFSIPACMLLTAGVVAGGAPAACPSHHEPTNRAGHVQRRRSGHQRPVTQLYQENTNTGYAILTVRPVHRVTLNLGYDITSTSGNDNWLRVPIMAYLCKCWAMRSAMHPGIPGNPGTVVTGATTSTGTIAFLGPFPNQPLGSQDFNWHNAECRHCRWGRKGRHA